MPRAPAEGIDDLALQAWAAARAHQVPPALTQKVIDAVVRVLQKEESWP
ncbi:MAG: hypothetical protein ACREJ3_04375 [Polyangiaceae bacterium]